MQGHRAFWRLAGAAGIRAGTLKKNDLNRWERTFQAETNAWNENLEAGKSRVSSGNGKQSSQTGRTKVCRSISGLAQQHRCGSQK